MFGNDKNKQNRWTENIDTVLRHNDNGFLCESMTKEEENKKEM